MRRTVVIGAGLSGLAAARALHDHGLQPEVLEACPTPGGLTRTTVVGQFCFDYTGHLLHLAHHDTPAHLPYAGQRVEDWMQVDRRSYCFVGGTLVPAPIQYNLGQLSPSLRAACIASYEAREREPLTAPGSLRDFIVRSFGRELAESFLIPQNEKTLAIAVDELSDSALRRFFPLPDDAQVRAGMVPGGATTGGGYNSRFWYPRSGGIARLVEGLAKGVERLSLCAPVVSLDLDRRTLQTADGRTIPWDVLLSSMPLARLCRIAGDPALAALGASLTHSATLCVNLGIRGKPAEALAEAHWVYVPDRAIPFYRFGIYSNLGGHVAPQGHSSLYLEVGFGPEASLTPRNLAAAEAAACDALFQLGWVQPEAIVCRVTQLLDCAYVHLTKERDGTVAAIHDRLAEAGVYLIGRYGCWDYTSMEDSIRSGIDTARRILT
jgi:protoporphyrinogen oxidase